MKTFHRVYLAIETGKEVRVLVEDSGDSVKYTMPDGEIHTCKARDAEGNAECAVVNKRANDGVV